ncbi:MAG: glycosyltransferase family 4 protein [Sulfitobacter sp.]
MTALKDIQVIAPNFKRRLSGVTATVVRLVPIQARDIAIVASGPVLPQDVPQIPLRALLTLPHNRLRVWHARRNIEMIAGLALKHLLRKRLKLLFTSASQRKQTGLTRWLIRRMDAVVATSDATAAYLERPADVIMHGIDLESFTIPTDRAALRARLGLPVSGILIGCYGRIRPSKGTDIFAAAMTALPPHLNAQAVIMGRATAKERTFLASVKEQAAKSAHPERFHFLPEVPVQDMADWYRALDLYVAPQRQEGFGLTPIEAMACGVPVIATRVGAFEKVVTKETGTLVPAGDAAALSNAIAAALTPPADIESWAQNARPHVAENFSITREAAALVALYHRLLEQ